MIADKFIDLYARNSGVRDKLVAERDVVLTYALHALHQAGVAEHLAFKGGTCLRKTVFGSTGRFSEDLDFTLDSALPADDVLVKLVEVFNREHHAVVFTFEEYYKTDDDGSFGGDVSYSHAWNVHGHFRLEASTPKRGISAALSAIVCLRRGQCFARFVAGRCRASHVRDVALLGDRLQKRSINDRETRRAEQNTSAALPIFQN